MTDFLLNLFGIRATGSTRIADAGVSLHGVNPLWIILAALLLGALVFFMYRRAGEGLSTFRRITLFSLRTLFLILILGLLLRPVLTVAFEHTVRRTILLVFDTSSSMAEIKDRRTDEADRKRVALVTGQLDPTKGLAQTLPQATAASADISRIDLARAAFKDQRLALLKNLSAQFDLAAFGFDRKPTEIPEAAYHATLDEAKAGPSAPQELPRLSTAWLDKLAAAGPVSAVGDAVGDVISAKRGQMLAGVVLVTDGASNAGTLPLDAAHRAGQERVPLYIYGVGVTSPRDIVVANFVLPPEVAFVDDAVPIQVLVRSAGLAGQTAPLVLSLGDQKVEQLVSFNADGQQIVTVNITPKSKGDLALTAAIAARDDEVIKDNNRIEHSIRVIDEKIKVLYVEQYPRWEFKYLQAALMRDRRIAPRFVLLEGDDSIARSKDSPYLEEFPQARDELLKYDVVILGDVDPRTLTEPQWETLHEFVTRFGGAVITIAGKRHMPASYRRTLLEKMLPVELDSTDVAPAPANKPVKLELTPRGNDLPMLRLTDQASDLAGQWSAMPPIYWIQKVARAKPGAEVLAVHPDNDRGSRQGKMPVIALHQYQLGQVLYVGTDNLWRWRRNAGDKYHATLWGQMVQRLAMPHLLGASKRTRIDTDAKTYAAGQSIKVFARLYSEGFQPMNDPSVRATLARVDQAAATNSFVLRPVPGHPGMYQGEVTPRFAGRYAISVDHDKDPQTAQEITVADQKVELVESAMNQSLLEAMAKASGGAFFREEDLHTLPASLTGKQERVRSRLDVELWSSPFYFLALVLVVTAEWILRKMSQLK